MLLIQGEISNLDTPYVIASYQNSDTVKIDTIDIDNKGKFSYFHKIDTFSILTLYFNNFHSSTIIFLEKGVKKIHLKGDAILSDLIEIKGGEVNNDLSIFKKENEAILKQRSLLMFKNIYENDSSTNSNNIITENEQIALINSLNHELAQKVEDFIIVNPEKISSVILINEFFKNNENPKTLERVIDYLKGDALNFPLTYKLKKLNSKYMISAEGADMPYFKLTDAKKKILESSDFLNKYLLISFLSSNGDESNENLKILKDEYNLLNKDSIEFLSIYIDSDTLPILYHDKDSIPWKIVTENKSWGSDIVEAYNVQYTPFNILIDPKGKIITRDIPVGDIKRLINSRTDKSKS
ncbi:MAG: DUF4369 domain-containing protein [Candidatus Saccharimonadaceae bacterium]